MHYLFSAIAYINLQLICNIFADSSYKTSIPFYISKTKVGLLTRDVASLLKTFPSVFELHYADNLCPQDYIKLCEKFKTFNERTLAVEKVVKELANQDAHISLKGWRNEVSDFINYYIFLSF